MSDSNRNWLPTTEDIERGKRKLRQRELPIRWWSDVELRQLVAMADKEHELPDRDRAWIGEAVYTKSQAWDRERAFDVLIDAGLVHDSCRREPPPSKAWILRLRKRGMPPCAIASRLGLSIHAVYSALGLPWKRRSSAGALPEMEGVDGS